MNEPTTAKPRRQEIRGLAQATGVALAAVAVLGAGVWLLARYLGSSPPTPDHQIRWYAVLSLGAVAGVVLVIIVHGMHETRTTRRVVAATLRDRAPLTHEEMGQRFYPPDLAPVASRLRRLLAENLDCDVAGLLPSDDFEQWLDLFPGPDSAADMFFEAVAVEFQLRRDCPWPKRFGSFDALVRFVAAHAPASQGRGP